MAHTRKSALTRSSTSWPAASTASHPPNAGCGGATQSRSTKAACTTAPASSTRGRARAHGMAKARAARASGAATRTSTGSVLERRELLGVERAEGALDVEHHEA